MDPKWFVQPGLMCALKLQLIEWQVIDWIGWSQSFSHVYEEQIGPSLVLLSTEMLHGTMSTVGRVAQSV